MLETTIPEINVSDLIEQVRAKAAQIEKIAPPGAGSGVPLRKIELPPLALGSALPPLILPTPPPARKERIRARLNQARDAMVVAKWIPKPLRGLFRNQAAYNAALVDSVASLAKANGELAGRLGHLIACVEVQRDSFAELHQRSVSDRAWMEAAAPLFESASGQVELVRRQVEEAEARHEQKHESLEGRLRELHEGSNRDLQGKIAALTGHLQQQSEAMAAQLAALQQETRQLSEGSRAVQLRVAELGDGFNALRRDGENSGKHLSNLQKELDRNLARINEHLRNLQALYDQSAGERERVANLQSDLARVGEHVRNLQALYDRRETALERGASGGLEVQRMIAALDERQTSEGAYFRMELSQQAALLRQWFGRSRSKHDKQLPAPKKEANQPAPGSLDAFYVSFEDRFRGPRREIKKRVEIYLPLIQKAGAGVKAAPILDVGCGRGEWLELLKEKKLQGEGVDLNSAMLAQCHQRKLQAVQADAVAHLRTLPANSLGAVTGFHIIEHLELDVLMDLLAETIRALRPGGLAIFESPNCKNLVVGATNFYIDPTHRNPIFPETAQFMLSIHGFEQVELKYLSPVEAERFAGSDRQSAVLNDLLYGPQDFAVIGTKPRSS